MWHPSRRRASRASRSSLRTKLPTRCRSSARRTRQSAAAVAAVEHPASKPQSRGRQQRRQRRWQHQVPDVILHRSAPQLEDGARYSTVRRISKLRRGGEERWGDGGRACVPSLLQSCFWNVFASAAEATAAFWHCHRPRKSPPLPPPAKQANGQHHQHQLPCSAPRQSSKLPRSYPLAQWR